MEIVRLVHRTVPAPQDTVEGQAFEQRHLMSLDGSTVRFFPSSWRRGEYCVGSADGRSGCGCPDCTSQRDMRRAAARGVRVWVGEGADFYRLELGKMTALSPEMLEGCYGLGKDVFGRPRRTGAELLALYQRKLAEYTRLFSDLGTV